MRFYLEYYKIGNNWVILYHEDDNCNSDIIYKNDNELVAHAEFTKLIHKCSNQFFNMLCCKPRSRFTPGNVAEFESKSDFISQLIKKD